MKDLITLTQVAKKIKVTPRTIIRWEQARKVPPAPRNWRGWRVYDKNQVKILRRFKNRLTP